MRRNGRRHIDDYLENEELNETYEEYEEVDVVEDSYAENEAYVETEEAPRKINIWVKIGKIAVVILVLIALFFISMKVTEIVLDRNQEPEYSSDAPVYSDDSGIEYENVPVIDEDAEDKNLEEDNKEEYKEYQEKDMTPVKKPEEDKKPEEKPEQTQKPQEKPAEKPEETQKPSTEPAPSKPSKPVIVPGNPAA